MDGIGNKIEFSLDRRFEMTIQKDDYIQGNEYFGHEIRRISGWVDSITNDGEHFFYNIQADDEYGGARGTTIYSELGKVTKLESKPRPATIL
jgi:hypothetical protein